MSSRDHVELTKDKLSEEQHERIQFELFKLVQQQMLHSQSKVDIARTLCAMKEMVDGEEVYVFRLGSGGTERVASERTISYHVKRYINNWEAGFAPQLRARLLEKMVKAAETADQNPAMMKVLTDKAMPQAVKHEVKHEGEIKHSARLTGLLGELESENLSQIPANGGGGTEALHAGISEEGHEVPVRDSAGSEECVALDVVPQGNDRLVHARSDDEGI